MWSSLRAVTSLSCSFQVRYASSFARRRLQRTNPKPESAKNNSKARGTRDIDISPRNERYVGNLMREIQKRATRYVVQNKEDKVPSRELWVTALREFKAYPIEEHLKEYESQGVVHGHSSYLQGIMLAALCGEEDTAANIVSAAEKTEKNRRNIRDTKLESVISKDTYIAYLAACMNMENSEDAFTKTRQALQKYPSFFTTVSYKSSTSLSTPLLIQIILQRKEEEPHLISEIQDLCKDIFDVINISGDINSVSEIVSLWSNPKDCSETLAFLWKNFTHPIHPSIIEVFSKLSDLDNALESIKSLDSIHLQTIPRVADGIAMGLANEGKLTEVQNLLKVLLKYRELYSHQGEGLPMFGLRGICSVFHAFARKVQLEKDYTATKEDFEVLISLWLQIRGRYRGGVPYQLFVAYLKSLNTLLPTASAELREEIMQEMDMKFAVAAKLASGVNSPTRHDFATGATYKPQVWEIMLEACITSESYNRVTKILNIVQGVSVSRKFDEMRIKYVNWM